MADDSIAKLGLDDPNLFYLKESMVGGQMIPVVGPDAVDIEFTDDNGTEQSGPLYRLVARRLLAKFGLPADDAITEQPWALFAAVGRIMDSVPNRRTKQIRGDISLLIADCMRRGRPGSNLCSLVKVAPFRLFVSMTPDDLLDRAIAENDPACELRTASYSPQAASESATDISRLRANQRGIFRLFGSCAGGSSFAHHEEDVLEYLHGLQSDGPRRCATVLTEMRRSHKIFVGCDLPDWLGRPLLRLVNDDRLALKETREFLCPSCGDTEFSAFLDLFSPQSHVLSASPHDLSVRLAEQFSRAPAAATTPGATPDWGGPSCGPTAFVSYASENRGAATRITDALLQAGFSDVWLDQRKLKGGDDWSYRIEDAIQECDFFVPIMSAQADARREGVYWEEWHLAVERSHRVKDCFLLPVGIDAEHPAKAGYENIPRDATGVFFRKHLIHAPDGELSATDREGLENLAARFRENGRG